MTDCWCFKITLRSCDLNQPDLHFAFIVQIPLQAPDKYFNMKTTETINCIDGQSYVTVLLPPPDLLTLNCCR